MIKQYRHPLCTHFCINPFVSPYRLYGIQREFLNKSPTINWFPSTFGPSSWEPTNSGSFINQFPQDTSNIDAMNRKDKQKNL